MTSVSHAKEFAPPIRWQRSLSKLEFGLVQAAVFLAPFISLRFSSVYITASDCIFLMAFLIRLRLGLPLRPLGSGNSFWLIGLVMLSSGLYAGSILNGDAVRGLIVTTQYQFSYLLLPLAVLGRPLTQAIRLVKCGLLSVVVLCLIGFGFYSMDYDPVNGEHFQFVTGNGRLASFTDSANGLAALVVMALPILGFLALARLISKLATITCAVVLIVALVLTSSNTGLLTAAVAVAVFLLVHRSFKMFLAGGTVGAAGWYVVDAWGHYFLPETFQKRVLTAVTTGDVTQFGTFTSRYDLMSEAISMLDKHILLGLGADQYREISIYHLPVHNMYLLLFIEGGFVSLLGWIIIQFAAAFVAYRGRKRPYGELAFCATVTLIAIVFTFGFASSHIYARYLIVPLLLALSPILTSDQPAVAPLRPVRRPRWRPGSPPQSVSSLS